MALLEEDDNGEIELIMLRGDSEELLVTVTDDADPAVAIDLSKAVDGTASRPAVVRFAVKENPDEDGNDEAVVYKTSYHTDEIPFLAQTGASLGQCRVLIDKPDTEQADVDTKYRWDLEVTRQDALRSGASVGTVEVFAATASLVGSSTQFQLAKVGDVIQLLGLLNTKPCIIEEILNFSEIVVSGFEIFQTESSVTFEIRRGQSKTVARGPFTLLSDVVSH